MPLEGICLRVTHTEVHSDSVALYDIDDGVDTLGVFRKAGPIYVPFGQTVELVYTSSVAKSFEIGAMRTFIEQGLLIAEFVWGASWRTGIYEVRDEGISLTLDAQILDFVGAGVVATNVGGLITVTIPGGGAGSDHATLSNLGWLVSAHTGAANELAGFDGAGATTTYSRTVTGDVSGTFPGPLTVTGFTFPGEAQGDVLYFDGTNWVILPAGVAGQVLTTGGAGADPSWTAASGVSDHTALSNLGWLVSAHTGAAGSFATFDGAGASAVLTGAAHGDIVYFDGTVWTRLAPGTAGERLQTNGAGAAPTWVAAGGGVTDHSSLTNLLWTASGHTGTATRIAAFDGGGAASYLQVGVDVQAWDADLDALAALAGTGIAVRTAADTWAQRTIVGTANHITVTDGDGVAGNPTLDVGANVILTTTALGGDLSGNLPNPDVVDLTITGEAQGSTLYFDGTNWVQLAPGTAGYVLQTNGAGADPTWVVPSAGTTDHTALSNLGWTVSDHTGAAGSLSTFDALGAAAVLTGATQGEVVYFDGTVWTALTPGSAGEFLQTQGAGSDPVWAVPTGFTWKQPVDVKGYLGTRTVAEIDLLTPTIGQSVVAGSAGTPTAGTSDLLAVGDVAEFDGTSWKKILGATGGFPPAGTRALVETDPITLYSPLVDGTDEGKCVEWDGTSLTPALVTPVDGDAVLVKGENSVNENKQYVFDGVVPSGEWVQFGGSGLAHSALSGLGWLASGHTGTAGSLATFDGAGAASFVTGAAHGDILYFDGTTWVRLPPGSVDGNPLTTQTAGAPPTWDTTIAVDTVTESTADNGVVVNTIRNYGKSAANPAVGPAPTDGDTYYNTSLRMNMVYDGLRSKWLSAESTAFHFGRDGNTKEGQYYRAADGRVMSATSGWYAERSGTIISMVYTRTDTDAANFDLVASGVSLHTVPSSAIGGRDITIDEDFTFGQVLAVLNQSGSATTSNVIAHIRVKWRA